MKFKKFLTFLSIISLFCVLFISVDNYIGQTGKKNYFYLTISQNLPLDLKIFLKEKIFVHKENTRLNLELKNLIGKNKRLEKFTNDELAFLEFKNNSFLEFNNEFFVKIFQNDTITKFSPKSYVEIYNNKLFLITGNGDIFYLNEVEDIFNPLSKSIQLEQIFSNLKYLFLENSALNFIDFDIWEQQVIKDILIYENKIFISYVKKIKSNKDKPILAFPDHFHDAPNKDELINELLNQDNDCYVNAIAVSDLNLTNLKFKDFLTFKECFADLAYSQTGGNLHTFKENEILMSTGDWRSYERPGFVKDFPQDINSYMGKILSINLKDKLIKIISLGHRNPQGMFYDKNDDILYMTEHGPQGGDEVNINVNPGKKVKNYGWAIASYGEYDDVYTDQFTDEEIIVKKKVGPLHKNHKTYGFEEPIIHFSPLSIGISEIVKADKFFQSNSNDQNLFFGSLGYDDTGKDTWSIHYLKLKNKKIIDRKVFKINERIRDLKKFNINNEDVLLMTLENGSIAIAKSKKF